MLTVLFSIEGCSESPPKVALWLNIMQVRLVMVHLVPLLFAWSVLDITWFCSPD